jgi:ribosomal protein S18 acetylase RimI-like enzyme
MNTMTMGIVPATRTDEAAVRSLLRSGRHVYADLGAEDLPSLLARDTAVIGNGVGKMVSRDQRMWGFAAAQIEDRPATLPASACTRARVRAVALAHGVSPTQRVPELMGGLLAHLASAGEPLQVLANCSEAWLNTPLLQMGFCEIDRIQFYELVRPARQAAHFSMAELHQPGVATLCAACRADLAGLAELDALAFPPLWHFGQRDLLELFVRSRLQVATVEGRLVGYAAVMTVSSREAQLARLAVHPDFQGQGVGRQLLMDAIAYAAAQEFGVLVLNTQTDNIRSQTLYQGAGFRPFGRAIPVLATNVAADPS